MAVIQDPYISGEHRQEAIHDGQKHRRGYFRVYHRLCVSALEREGRKRLGKQGGLAFRPVEDETKSPKKKKKKNGKGQSINNLKREKEKKKETRDYEAKKKKRSDKTRPGGVDCYTTKEIGHSEK